MNRTALVTGGLLISSIAAIWGLQPAAETAITNKVSGSTTSGPATTSPPPPRPEHHRTAAAATTSSAVASPENSAAGHPDNEPAILYAEDFEKLSKEQQMALLSDSREAEPLSLPYKTPRKPSPSQLAWFELVQQQYQWPFNEILLVSEETLKVSDTERQRRAMWQAEESTQSHQRKKFLEQEIRRYQDTSLIQVMHLNCRGQYCELLGLSPDTTLAERFIQHVKRPPHAETLGRFDSAYWFDKVDQQFAFQLFLTFHA